MCGWNRQSVHLKQNKCAIYTHPLTLWIHPINYIYLSVWRVHKNQSHTQGIPLQIDTTTRALSYTSLDKNSQSLFMWLLQFKTNWFMTLMTLCFGTLNENCFHSQFFVSCIHELSLLPVDDCTHVEADILKSPHSAFFHRMHISWLVIH